MISLVVPCYNEGSGLRLTCAALVAAANGWDEATEIVLVDDGSSDDTWSVIEEQSRRDGRVRGVRLQRNFGHQAAVGAGLEQARGQAVVVLDADLQDPPELIGRMIALWREGNEIVYAQRNRRHGETVFKRLAGNLFYRLLEGVTDVEIPRDTGDFALLDARVVRQLLAFREKAVFWRGLRCWTGVRQAAVHFDRPARAFGESKYTLKKLCALASAGLFSFSAAPLRLAGYAGMLTIAGAAAMVGTDVLWCLTAPGETPWLAGPVAWAGFFLGGVQLLAVGILGEYVYRIYDEVRDRPRWLIAETTDHAEAAPPAAPWHRKAG